MNVVRQEFDSLAPVYETNRLAPWYQAHGDVIMQRCSPVVDGDVLDIGCGTGYFLRQLLSANSASRGLGLDVSSVMVDEARKNAESDRISNVKFLQGDFENIELEELASYNFQTIVCANAFHYFADPQGAAAKMYGLLGDNGMLYILERDKTNSMMTHVWDFLHRNYIKDSVEFYSRGQLMHYFELAGFEKTSVVASIRKYFWKRKLFTSIVLLCCTKASAA